MAPRAQGRNRERIFDVYRKTQQGIGQGGRRSLPAKLQFHDTLAVAITTALRSGEGLGLLVVSSTLTAEQFAEAPAWQDPAGRHHWVLRGNGLEERARRLIKGDARTHAGLALLAGRESLVPEALERRAAEALAKAQEQDWPLVVETARAPLRVPPPITFEALQLHFQPQIALSNGAISGVEALIRVHDAQVGWMAPGVLQDWSRDADLAQELGEWVLREALSQAASWRAEGLPPVTLAVNLSLAQLRHPHAIHRLLAIIQDSDLPPASLELELTEQLPPDSLEVMTARLAELRKAGVALALDDFGSGFASLALLHALPLDRVKLAARLLEQGPQDHDRGPDLEVPDLEVPDLEVPDLEVFVRHAQAMGLQVVAEGIEQRHEMEFLQAIGCDYLQGFYFSPPLPVPALRRLLIDQSSML